MRGENGKLVRGESEVKGVWKGYFEQLMNGKTVVTTIGIEAGRGRLPIQREIGRAEVEKEQKLLWLLLVGTRSWCIAASFNNLPFETSTLQLLGLFTTS